MTNDLEQPQGFVGRSLPRIEDDRLVRGAGRFVADLHVHDAAEVAFMRSTYAHARILRLDTSAARSMPGVIAVYEPSDVVDRIKPLVNAEEMRVPPGIAELGPINKVQPAPILAGDEVSYVGQPVVMIIAESRYLAEDAIEAIDIDYEELPAVVDLEAAIAPGAPLVLLGCCGYPGGVRPGKGGLPGKAGLGTTMILPLGNWCWTLAGIVKRLRFAAFSAELTRAPT